MGYNGKSHEKEHGKLVIRGKCGGLPFMLLGLMYGLSGV